MRVEDGSCREVLRVVRRVAERFGLQSGSYVAVFGSVAEGRCTALSDVDLAVRGLSPVEAGRLAEAVEAVLIEKASLPLRYEALVRGVFVAGDRRAFVVDRWRAMLFWLDCQDAYRVMHRSYRRRVLASGALR